MGHVSTGMSQSELCRVCGEVPAYRDIGTVPYCWVCSEAFLKPIRARVAQYDKELLEPSWLSSDAGSPRYDHLSDVDKRIWRATRGQTRETDSVAAWQKQLARAVHMGWITYEQARAAKSRYGV